MPTHTTPAVRPLTARSFQIIQSPAPAPGFYGAAKPYLDFVAALCIGIAVLPVLALAWAAVRITSAGPGVYTQVRSGFRGRDYTIFKLRSMTHNCESQSGIRWATKRDSRVTPIGQFLRVTHLDELPQLWNVLRGEMSLVGPRPERPEVIRAKGLCDLVPGYEDRMQVRPGVTGFAQVQLPADTDIASVRAKVSYDLYYVRHQSLGFDVRILLATAFKAAGVGPVALRKLFRLPTPEQVVAEAPAVVLDGLVPVAAETAKPTRKAKLAAA